MTKKDMQYLNKWKKNYKERMHLNSKIKQIKKKISAIVDFFFKKANFGGNAQKKCMKNFRYNEGL